MQDDTYKTMYLLLAREQHESQLTQAIRERRAFTMLKTDLQGRRYGVRYGIPNLSNTGGFWKA